MVETQADYLRKQCGLTVVEEFPSLEDQISFVEGIQRESYEDSQDIEEEEFEKAHMNMIAQHDEEVMKIQTTLSRKTVSDPISNNDQYRGDLEKKSPSLLKGWQTRFFVLKNRKLTYYKSKTERDKPKGIINFELVGCRITFNQKKFGFNLILNGISRVFKLRTKNINDYNTWTFKIMRNLEKSRGVLENLGIDEKLLSFKSWRYDRIDEHSFLKMADIGDILLFRGLNVGAKITRGLTQSKFDHVALILRFDAEHKEVFFFDATANGVTITRWNRFRLFYNQCYKHVFFRHLYCERDEEFLLELEKFIKTTVGNQYSISVKKVLFNRKTTHEKIEKRRFFCSELIAKAYKMAGILQTDDACCQFMPQDFCRKGRIKLSNEAKLGEELLIMFDEESRQKELKALEEEKKRQEAANNISQVSTEINSKEAKKSE